MQHVVLTVLLVVYGKLINGSPLEIPSDSSKFFSQRIIGGEDAPEAYAPHMVALISDVFFAVVTCGGSIISERHILTAAHCIDPYLDQNRKLVTSFYGRVGSNQWNSSGVIIKFQDYKNHPEWDPHYIKYDAGILILKQKLKFNVKIRSISLKFERVDTKEVFATGWGRVGPRTENNIVQLAPTPDNLQLLYMKTITHQHCSKEMHAASLIWGLAPHVDPEVELCTFHSVGHGMCNGDSGSALVTVKDQRQVGIVSWGLPCAIGAPDVFVRVSGIKTFILTTLESSV